MPYKLNKLKRHHIPKQGYKLSNWSEYKQALKNRGQIDLWLSDDIETGRAHPERVHEGTGSVSIIRIKPFSLARLCA